MSIFSAVKNVFKGKSITTSIGSSASSGGGGQVAPVKSSQPTSTSNFDAKAFIESGGTKTDVGSAINRFNQDIGKGSTSINTYKPSGGGSGGGGSSSSSFNTQEFLAQGGTQTFPTKAIETLRKDMGGGTSSKPSSSFTGREGGVLGGIQTKGEFETSKIYESYSNQIRGFEQLPSEEQLAMSFNPSSGVYGTSTSEGILLSYTPSLSTAKQYAKESYSQLPTLKKVELVGADIGFGLAKAGVGIAGFTGDVFSLVGTKTLKSGEDFKMFDTSNFGKTEVAMTKLPFIGGGIKDISSTQVGTPGKVTEIGVNVGLIAYSGWKGVTGFKTLKSEFGTGGAITESIGSFSSMRPVPGVYKIPITESSEIKALSFKETIGDITTRNIIGKGKGFDLYSKQVSKELAGGGSFGVSETIIKQPAFIVGGGKIKNALVVSKSEGFLGSQGDIGKVLATKDFGGMKISAVLPESFTGGISQSLSRTKFTGLMREVPKKGIKFSGEYFNNKVFKIGKGGGYSEKVNEALSGFGFGKRKAIYKVTREPDYFLYEPSGKYKIQPNIKGYEIDLGKINLEGGTGVKVIKPSEITKTPLSKTFAPQQTVQVQKLQTNLKNPLSKSMNAQMQDIQSALKFETPKIDLKTSGKMMSIPSLKSEQKQGVMSKSLMVQPSVDLQREFQKQNQFQMLGNIVSPKSIVKSKQSIINIQIPAQTDIQIGKQQQRITNIFKIPQKIITPVGFGNYEFTFKVPPPPFPLPPLLGQESGRRKKKGSRKYFYTPSFGAVKLFEMGIAQPKTSKMFQMSGLGERPFKKGIKLPNVL